MAVPAGVARTRNIGAGSPGPFAFNFVLYDGGDLRVVRTDTLGVDTLLTITTDYSVTIATDFSSATVTLTAPLAGSGVDDGSSQILTITRDPPVQQLTQWPRNDPFPSRTHERAADLAVMMIGRLNEQIGRSLLLPESSTITGLTLPNPDPLLFLRWNATGDALENMNVSSPGVLVVSPFVQTLLDDVNAAAFRTSIGAGTNNTNADVVGPAGATAQRIARFQGTTGKIIEDSGVNIFNVGAGKQSMWIPALAMHSPGSPNIGVVNIGGALFPYLAFDPTTSEFAFFNIGMPKSWNEGTLTAKVYWTHPATTVNFGTAWAVQLASFGDGDPLANAYIGPTITDTGGVTSSLYISTEGAPIDPGNTEVEGDWLAGLVSRIPADVGDTMAVDAYLIGIMLHYTTNVNQDI